MTELQTLPPQDRDGPPGPFSREDIPKRGGTVLATREDPCDRFRRELTVLRDQADADAQDSLIRGVFDLVGLGFVYDLAKGDAKSAVAIGVIIDLVLAGALLRALPLIGRLAERLGVGKRALKILGRFAGFVGIAILVIDAGSLVYGYLTRYDDLNEFLPSFEAESQDCPEADRKRIIAELGLGG